MTFNVHRWIGWFFSGCGPSFPERTVDAATPPTTDRLRYGIDVYVPPSPQPSWTRWPSTDASRAGTQATAREAREAKDE